MAQPAKVATPDTAAWVRPQVQESVPAGPVLMLSVTAEASLVTTLLLASSTLTTGCVEQTTPSTQLAGVVIHASLEAAPILMVKLALLAAVSPPSAAWSV